MKDTTARSERAVLDVIRDINGGSVNPKQLSTAERRACVKHLGAEGFSVADMAQILKRNERTIARDRQVLQEEAALEHDPRLCGQLAGRLVSEADCSIWRMRRVARDRETPPQTKVDAEKNCFAIFSELIQRLQSLGFLPSAAQRIEARLTHQGEVPEYEHMLGEIHRLQQLNQTAGGGAAVLDSLAALEDTATRGRLAERIDDAGRELEQREDDHAADGSPTAGA